VKEHFINSADVDKGFFDFGRTKRAAEEDIKGAGESEGLIVGLLVISRL
jgi:hypothetical protein